LCICVDQATEITNVMAAVTRPMATSALSESVGFSRLHMSTETSVAILRSAPQASVIHNSEFSHNIPIHEGGSFLQEVG
jgi:hypothetical protein